jgi:hypothetical protein
VAESADGPEIGVANIAGHVRGPSVGVANIADEVSGLQVGVLNVATKMKGFQLGVITVADELDGAALSLIPIVGNGYNRVTVSTSDLAPAQVSLKLGGPYLYTTYAAGFAYGQDADRVIAPGQTGDDTYLISMGLGVHLQKGMHPFFLDTEILGTHVGSRGELFDMPSVIGTLRLTGGYEVAKHLAVIAGISYNVETSWDGADRNHRQVSFLSRTIREGDTTVRMYPGFFAGLQF